ncbi:MAG: AMP-binding protein [Flammeovirgaceae bacterium]|nr:AMP-binding protein [Flammeovirgaceae bacterium]
MYEYNLDLRFQNIVERYPKRASLWFNESEIYTYRELNRYANRLARFLVQLGLVSGDVVCLSGIKSVHTFALILACLKTGVIYSVFWTPTAL